jgi:hypothetical protein
MDDFEQFLKNQPLRAAPPQWRGEILAAAARQPAARAVMYPWWRAWLWPSPYAWGALAAVWVAIFILNAAAQPGHSLTPRDGPAPTVDEMVAMLNEQRRELDELMAEEKVVATAPPPPATPAVRAVSPGACLTPREAEQPQYA